MIMKKLILTLLAATAMLFCMTPNSQAGPGVRFGIFVGPPVYPGYYPPGPYYGPGYYGYYGPHYYHPYWHRGYRGWR